VTAIAEPVRWIVKDASGILGTVDRQAGGFVAHALGVPERRAFGDRDSAVRWVMATVTHLVGKGERS
jgi:hypothetical protein